MLEKSSFKKKKLHFQTVLNALSWFFTINFRSRKNLLNPYGKIKSMLQPFVPGTIIFVQANHFHDINVFCFKWSDWNKKKIARKYAIRWAQFVSSIHTCCVFVDDVCAKCLRQTHSHTFSLKLNENHINLNIFQMEMGEKLHIEMSVWMVWILFRCCMAYIHSLGAMYSQGHNRRHKLMCVCLRARGNTRVHCIPSECESTTKTTSKSNC